MCLDQPGDWRIVLSSTEPASAQPRPGSQAHDCRVFVVHPALSWAYAAVNGSMIERASSASCLQKSVRTSEIDISTAVLLVTGHFAPKSFGAK